MVSSLFEIIDDPQFAGIDDPEERFTRSEVNWQQYEAVLAKLQDNNHYRVTYLDGILEIVSPSIRHEKLKKRLATLVEFYLLKKRIKHTPMGSPTIRKRLKRAGAEPDECYCIGEEKSIPDLAIEVV
ncbi:MAG: Uma2 family endonuclease, partial [Coleofasciculaceae cyanobacterium]